MASPDKQALPPAYRLVIGDELGLVRLINVPEGPKWDATTIVDKWGEPDRSRGIQHLAISAAALTSKSDALLAASRKGGKISILNAESGSSLCDLQPGVSGRGADEAADIIGLAFLHKHQGNKLHPNLACCQNSGLVTFYAADGASSSQYSQISQLQGAAQSMAMAVAVDHSRLALGGQTSHLQVLDIETKEKIFVPKGGKPDKVSLP